MHYGIIAAGEGSRLAQEGVSLPKPLVKICGQPMIKRLIDIFTANNAESISVIVNEQMTEVREFIERLSAESAVPLHMVVKSTPSSMHSFYHLANLMEGRGRFILTTVDTIFRPEDFARYAKSFSTADERIQGMMALTSFIDDEKPLYVNTDESMRIQAFLDKPEPGIKYVSGGIYGLDENGIRVLRQAINEGQSRMRNYQRALLEKGLFIQGYDMGKIIDVDHAEDIPTAEEFLSN